MEQERISLDQTRTLEKMVVELTEQKRILQTTLNAIADGVAVADSEGRVTHLNPAAEALVGTGKIGPQVERWSEVYGRQEPWEDSPPGWPQQWGVSPGHVTRINGRPIAQWSRLKAGRSDDLAVSP